MVNSEMLTSVKDRELIIKRRNQMIQAAISLFKERGFHRTTTREIAKESGFSIGTLYDYIRTKEDILYFVCDSVYENVKEQLEEKIDLEKASIDHFVNVVKSYFYLMDEMQEEVLILYQEVNSLSKETQEEILQKERNMVHMLENVIVSSFSSDMAKKDRELLANNIFIQGQMWGFRRWMLHPQFTLEEYIDYQIKFLLQGMASLSIADEINVYYQRRLL